MIYGLLIVVRKTVWSTIPTLFCASIPFAAETSFLGLRLNVIIPRGFPQPPDKVDFLSIIIL